MLRILVTVLLPLAAPFLVYLAWAWLVRRRVAAGFLTIDWREAPWPWLLALGVCWSLAGVVYIYLSTGYPAGTRLEPPALVDGKVVPSHPSQ